MKNVLKQFGLFLTFFFLLTSGIMAAEAKAANPASDKLPENFYTEDKQNIIITNKQPEFTLRLKSNPTTGYVWYLREYNNNLVTPIKHRFVKPEKQNLMGAPGYELWTFKMKPTAFIVPQQTVIRMVYSRASQGTDNSTQLVFRVSTQG